MMYCVCITWHNSQVLSLMTTRSKLNLPLNSEFLVNKFFCRSIIIKSQIEPKLGMIKQLEEGLSVCKLLDAIRARPALFRAVFVSGCIFDLDADEFLDGLKVAFSENQQERIIETTVYKHFCDFVLFLHNNGKHWMVWF